MNEKSSMQARFLRFLISLLFFLTMALSVSYTEEAFAATPKTPGKVTVSSVTAPAYNKVTVKWKKASNVTSYNVYYKESGAGKWTKLANVGKSTTSYTHTSSTKYKLTPGKTYYYTVRGYNSKIKKSGSYNKTGLKVVIPGKPSKVAVKSAKAESYKKVTVKWKKVKNATSYRVYYKESGSNKWKALANVSSSKTSYTHTSSTKHKLTPGKTYYYTVKAYNKTSKTWGSYDKTGAKVVIPGKPSTVVLKSATSTASNKVTVSWEKASETTAYRIYYKKSGSANWTRIATVNSSNASYVHTSSTKYPLAAGTTYYYTVRAYNETSKTLGSYDKTGKSVTMPSAPTATPKPTEKPKPTETPKPEPTKVPEPTEAPKPTEKPEQTVTPKPTATPTPTKKPESTATPKPTATPTPKPTINPDEMAKEVLRLTNIEREKAGSAPLTYNADIQKAAMLRAKEISVKFDHNRPNGENFSTVFYEFDIGGCSGENIAIGQSTPELAVKSWMNSPGHKAAILRETNIYLGVGFYQKENGVCCWVQNFASKDPYAKGKISFDANGGEFADGTTKIVYTAPSGKPFAMADAPIPTREGYRFVCWMNKFGDKDLISTVFSHQPAVYEYRNTFTAQWEKLQDG